MLAAFTLNQSGATINLSQETSVFPYPSWSEPTGTVVAQLTWTDTFQLPSGAFATPQNVATFIGGSTSNLAGGADGKAFQISGSGTISVYEPSDLEGNPSSFTLMITDIDNETPNPDTATTGTITISMYPIAPTRPIIPQFPYQNDTFATPLGPTVPDGSSLEPEFETGDDPSSNTNFPTTSLDYHPTGGEVNLLRVKENSPAGTIVGTVTAVATPGSQDDGPLTYTFQGLVPGFSPTDPAIAIDPYTGVIRIIDPSFFNYEALRTPNLAEGDLGEGHVFPDGTGNAFFVPDVTLQVQVRATNLAGQYSQTAQPGGGVTDSYIYIRVLDVGEIPPNVSQSTTNMSVNEGVLPGDVIVAGASVNGTSVGFFDMINGVPDYFNAALPQLEVASASGNSVRVAKPASVIGLTTIEGQQRYSYSIVGGQSNGEFVINPDTGEVRVGNASAINFEKLEDYTLQIKVTSDNPDSDFLGAVQDVAPLSTVASLHIHVNDVINQTYVEAPSTPFSIPEGSVNGTIVGASSVQPLLVVNGSIATPPLATAIAVYNDDTTQPNGQAVLRYSITSGNNITINGTQYNGIFAIDPVTGLISVDNTTGLPNTTVLHYLTQQSFQLVVTVIDRGDLATAGSAAVTINLKPVDTTPPVIQNGSATINEFQPNGTVVGQVVASAGQTDFSLVNYQILAGNTGNAFAINPTTGVITVNNSAATDFQRNPVFNLTVEVTDNGSPSPLSATGTFTINLLEVNQQIVMLNQNFTVNAGTPNGTIIGQVVTTDPDNEVKKTQGESFVIDGGDTGGAFSIDNQGNIIVTNSAALDFYVNPSFNLVATVTDTGVPPTSATATLTINLNQVNVPPTIGNQSFNLPSHSLAGTVVGTVVATDENIPAETLSYAITGGDPTGAFVINSATGVLTVTDPHLIDYNTTPTFNLTVTVTNSGLFGGTGVDAPQSSSATITIDLLNDQNPILTNQTVSIPETAASGTQVTTVTATHGVGPYTYSIIGGDTNTTNGQTNAFAIDPNTGIITVSNTAALSFHTQPSFALQVLVVDNGQAVPLGDTATITINLLQYYHAPTLSGIESTTLNYVEQQTTPVSNTIAVVDLDPVMIASATIQISSGYVNGQDTLVFTNTPTINGKWNPTTATMTLMGVDTIANYTAALRAVAFQDLAYIPSTVTRTVSYTVTTTNTVSPAGPEGVLTSNTVSRNLVVIPVFFPPTLSGIETTPLNYVEHNTTAVTNTVTATDLDRFNLEGAVVQITGNYVNGQDTLLFTNTPTITGIWNSTNGTMTLTGVDTLANYNAALRSITYHNLSYNPSTLLRTVSFTVTDDKGLTSNTVTRQINVIPVNNPPALIDLETTPLVWTEGVPTSVGVPVTSTLVATDSDTANATSATIQITGNYIPSEDVLSFINTAKISGMWNPATGTMTLTGTDSFTDYRLAIRSVLYNDLSRFPNTAERTLTFQITDDKGASSPTVTRNVTVVPFNVSPVLSGPNSLSYTEQDPPMPIDPTIVVSDPGTPTLASATITMTNFTPGGQDVLGFINDGVTMGNIAIQSNAGGVLTLTSAGSTATVAQWQSALEAVTYRNLSDNPNTSTRIVTFQVNSGLATNAQSNVLTSTISITTLADPPLITNQDLTPLAYTEDGTAVAIVPNVLVADPKESFMSGATIQITGNYNSVSDSLLFTNTPNITGNWNPATGTLTLSGIDTVSNYRTALRSVEFFNQHDNVTTPPRTVSFTAVDDIGLVSNTISRTINISTVNEAPVLSGIETSTHVFKANDPFTPPSPITSSLVVTDFDRPTLTSATIQITGNYSVGQDRLGFNISGTSISGSWNQTTGTLTLYGVDTVANYQAALRTVVYYNVAAVPTTTVRTVSFKVNDNTNLPSNVVTRTVSILTTNTPPTITLNSPGTVNYTQGNPAISIAPALTIFDPDSPNMQSAFVKITGNYQQGQDFLTFKTTGNLITGVFNAATGTLTLTGGDTQADYQAALRSVSYINTSGNPSTLTRTINFVVNDGLAPSGAINGVQVTVTAVAQPPVVAVNAGDLTYTPSQGAVALVPGLTVTDPDSTTLASAAITISFNYQPGKDVLSFVNTPQITGVFNAATGTLQLTGVDTVADYRAALRSVMYQFNGTPITSTKIASIVVSDGVVASAAVTRNIDIS